MKNVFKGEKAIKEFLAPGSIGFTPVVELPDSLNPFRKESVRIFVKMMQMVPLFNIKSLPSYSMLENADLSGVKHLAEYSSGNTALSLTVIAKHFGVPNTHALITSAVPEHKKRLLQLIGTNILISHGPACPDVHSKEGGGVYEAGILGKKRGWHNLNQYINQNSIKASQRYIGRELWGQFGKDISILMASIGTAGTITGAASYLSQKNPEISIWGTAIKKGSSIPGPRGEENIHKLAFGWEEETDKVISVNTKQAFQSSLEMIRLGLFVGPSTGMQLSALIKCLKEYKRKRKLNELRNAKGEIVACFLACDTMFPYIDDYFSILPEKFFPKVKHLK